MHACIRSTQMTSHTIAHMHYTSLHIYSFVLCMYQAETSWTCIRHVQLYYRQELRQNFDYSNTTDVVVQPSKPVVVPLPPYYYSQYTWQLQKKKCSSKYACPGLSLTHQFDLNVGGLGVQGVFQEFLDDRVHGCDYLGTGEKANRLAG